MKLTQFVRYSILVLCIPSTVIAEIPKAHAKKEKPSFKKGPLNGINVAILVADGFEESEMVEPRQALKQKGAETTLISDERSFVRAWNNKDRSKKYPVDLQLESARAQDYDALLLPGGVMNPDRLRIDQRALNFVKEFINAQKPIAAICHGPWTLINADGVKDRTLTSWPSLRVDLINAGAHWVDQEVVVDGNLITSRKPADIPAFNQKFIEMLEELHK